MSKSKFVPLKITTLEGCLTAVAHYVQLKLAFAARNMEMEREIARLQEKYQEGQSALGDQIEGIFAGVQAYCTQHRGEVFGPECKSRETIMATFGFRTNPPSVELARRKLKWGAVAKLLTALDWGLSFVRYPEPEVDKQAVLAARSVLRPEQLAEAGLVICQEEEFFIAPKSEVVDGDKTEGLLA